MNDDINIDNNHNNINDDIEEDYDNDDDIFDDNIITSSKSPFEAFLNGFNDGNQDGMNVQIKRKLNDGTLLDISDNTMSVLNTKSRIAANAKVINDLPLEERYKWGIEMKTFANTLFNDGNYQEAMEKYAEALTASDFGNIKEGDGKNRGNVDILVTPVLTNLAACCIHLKQWNKAVQFCKQAIELNPACAKAYLRLGLGQLYLGEFANCKSNLNKALEVANNPSLQLEQSMTLLNDADKQRIKILLAKADEGLKYDKKAEEKMRKALSKAFSDANRKSVIAEKEPVKEKKSNIYYYLPKEIRQLITLMINLFFKFFQIFQRKIEKRITKSNFGKKVT